MNNEAENESLKTLGEGVAAVVECVLRDLPIEKDQREHLRRKLRF
jgi:hypothetical protein